MWQMNLGIADDGGNSVSNAGIGPELPEVRASRRGMIGPPRDCSDKFFQLLKIDRFGQMMIESGVHAPAHIFLHAKATEGDTHQRLPLSGYTHDVTAVAIGQPDVAD